MLTSWQTISQRLSPRHVPMHKRDCMYKPPSCVWPLLATKLISKRPMQTMASTRAMGSWEFALQTKGMTSTTTSRNNRDHEDHAHVVFRNMYDISLQKISTATMWGYFLLGYFFALHVLCVTQNANAKCCILPMHLSKSQWTAAREGKGGKSESLIAICYTLQLGTQALESQGHSGTTLLKTLLKLQRFKTQTQEGSKRIRFGIVAFYATKYRMRLFCLQLEASHLQWSFFTYHWQFQRFYLQLELFCLQF